VLTIGRDHHDVMLAIGLHLGEGFSNLGGWCDREIAHHVKTNIPGRPGSRLVSAQEIPGLARNSACVPTIGGVLQNRMDFSGHFLLPYFTSWAGAPCENSGTRSWSASPGVSVTRVMASVGQVSMHRIQPLQYW